MAFLEEKDLSRFATIKHCNGGYVVMNPVLNKKTRACFNGSSVLMLSRRCGWIPYRNRDLDECTHNTEKEAKYLLKFGSDPFMLGGAL